MTIKVGKASDADPLAFDVEVGGKGDVTRHHVTLTRADHARLAAAAGLDADAAPERLIEAAFRFLLDREPKEAILASFDVAVIARYFPEFERELPHYL